MPWPGDSACSAPHPKAASSSSTSTPSPEAARSNSEAKPSLPARVVGERRRPRRAGPPACRRRARPRSWPRAGRAGCSAGPPGSGAGRSSGRRSGAWVRTAVPSPGSATIAFQPTRSGKVPSSQLHPAAASRPRADRSSSTRVVRSPPLPAGNADAPGGRRASSAHAPAVHAQRQPRPRPRRACAASTSAAALTALLDRRDLRLVEHVADVDRVRRRSLTVLRWLIEKLPSGWAAAAGGERGADQRQAATTSSSSRAPHRSASLACVGLLRREQSACACDRDPQVSRCRAGPPPLRRCRRGSGTAGRASPSRSARRAQRSPRRGRPARGQRPAERVGGADARRRAPHAPAELDRSRRASRGRPRTGPPRRPVPWPPRDRGPAARGRPRARRRPRRRCPSARSTCGEQGQRAGRAAAGRQPDAGGRRLSPDRRPPRQLVRVRPCRPGIRAAIAGPTCRPAARVPARPRCELEVAEQHLHVGHVLGRAAGRGRQPHRLDRAGEVARQLAVVGRARVGGQARLGVEQPLDRAPRPAS